MRYGQPSIPETLTRLKAEGCTRILLLPLYPQYASSTSATAYDAVCSWAQATRNQPEIRSVRSFADHPGYIAALAASVREHWANSPRPADSYRLIMSFHGVPRYTLDKGDPYHCECQKTGRLLAEALGLSKDEYQICFQSRFGRAEWLQPYTAQTLHALGEQGIQRVDMICPGFPADCLETLEEIAMEGKAEFIQAGGKEYRYIPCLNERDDWIRALADIATTHLQGWPTGKADPAALEISALRARALGAGS
jgi:ferrochelatase